ncbi:expressed conserved protein [Echinococcus multilocularis]|uniref:Expressed conserved protein n=1 Tax=Echinococcus multilocularis TaxID=6211 RepID=A0A087VYC7_ECHMU|nr:expressed conserved protein [Echinococcus multilocularis]
MHHLGVLISLGLLTTCAVGLTSYERSFTPYSNNLSCYVCEPGSMNLTNRTYVQWKIENMRCEEPTEDLLQLCKETEIFKPRGCGKLVTKSYQQINFGGEREVKLVRRFCASSGMNLDEQKCVMTMSQGRWTEVCVCGGEACNGVVPSSSSSSSFSPSYTSHNSFLSSIHHTRIPLPSSSRPSLHSPINLPTDQLLHPMSCDF